MKQLLLFFISSTIILVSCQSDTDVVEKSVEEIQATIVDNPVKRDAPKKQIRKEQNLPPADTVNVGAFKFDEEVFEFGIVDEGEKVEHTFSFKNTGKVPLLITNAKGSCGCTVPKWPQEPIAVGESGEIKVSFNTSGKKNQQSKTVTLTANTFPVNTVLTLKGEVTPKEQPKKADEHAGHDHSTHDHGSHDGHNH